MNNTVLPEQTDAERLKVYRMITSAATHLYSKNKLQTDKVKVVLRDFYPLAKNDPLFVAKLAAWASSDKNESRDLQLISLYLNAVNDADGTPFVAGGSVCKPNLRLVTHSLLSSLNPKELFRLAYMKRLKWSPNGQTEAQHFPRSLKNAIRQYLELLPVPTLKAHVKHGFSRHLAQTFRLVHGQPSATQAKLLRWNQQEKRGIEVEKETAKNPFAGFSDKKIADKITDEKIPFRRALSYLEKEPSLPILEALLDVGSPNELLVQTSLFDKGGLLAVAELAERFYAKLSQANSADRLDTIKFETTEGVKEKLADARAKSRQNQFGMLDGSMYVAIDKSGSQEQTINTAKEYAATLCEIAGQNNFDWGLFDVTAYPITTKPTTKEQAMAALYLYRGNGGTDCFANYRAVMQKPPVGKPVDYFIWFTDGGHAQGSTDLSRLEKPKAAIIIKVPSQRYGYSTTLEDALRKNGIPFAVHEPSLLRSSNLVVQALKAVIKGEVSIITEIMETPFKIKIEGVS